MTQASQCLNKAYFIRLQAACFCEGATDFRARRLQFIQYSPQVKPRPSPSRNRSFHLDDALQHVTCFAQNAIIRQVNGSTVPSPFTSFLCQFDLGLGKSIRLMGKQLGMSHYLL